jgi:hypothetical protein
MTKIVCRYLFHNEVATHDNQGRVRGRGPEGYADGEKAGSYPKELAE